MGFLHRCIKTRYSPPTPLLWFGYMSSCLLLAPTFTGPPIFPGWPDRLPEAGGAPALEWRLFTGLG